MQWDDTLSGLIKEVADKYNVPTDQAKLLIETYCSCSMKAMRQYQPVVWANLGKFYLDQNKTIKSLQKSFNQYRNGTITKDELLLRLDIVYPLHEAARWHKPRTGKRYLFLRFLEELEKQGIKYKPSDKTKLMRD